MQLIEQGNFILDKKKQPINPSPERFSSTYRENSKTMIHRMFISTDKNISKRNRMMREERKRLEHTSFDLSQELFWRNIPD